MKPILPILFPLIALIFFWRVFVPGYAGTSYECPRANWNVVNKAYDLNDPNSCYITVQRQLAAFGAPTSLSFPVDCKLDPLPQAVILWEKCDEWRGERWSTVKQYINSVFWERFIAICFAVLVAGMGICVEYRLSRD